VGEDRGNVLGVQGPVLVGEPDTAVQLRVPGELPVEARMPMRIMPRS